MRTTILILAVGLMLLPACRAVDGDPQCVYDGAGKSIRGENELSQTQANVMPGVGISREGDVDANTTRLGVDVQSGAQAAPNGVHIASIVGGQAAEIMRTQTPEEKALQVKIARVQKMLTDKAEDLSIAPDEKRPAIEAKMAQLKADETEVLGELRRIYNQKLSVAAEFVPDLGALERVYYMINAPQITTTGKTFSDANSEHASAAFQKFLEEFKKVDDETEDEGGAE